jgi:hypothetical protein
MTTVAVEVERPADQAFAYATDPAKFSEWQGGVVSGSMESIGTPAVGDHCRMTRRIGGADRPSTSVPVRLDPPGAWSVHGIGKVFVPLVVQRQARNEMPRNIANLKARLEGE